MTKRPPEVESAIEDGRVQPAGDLLIRLEQLPEVTLLVPGTERVSLHQVEATVPRAGLWRAQTPQAFRRDWLEEAHRTVKGAATDDAALVEALGHPARITPGDPVNFKITTRQDLELAEAWLTARAVRS